MVKRDACVFGILVATILAGTASAEPVVSSFSGGDAGYVTLTNNSEWEQGAVEGRIGNLLDTGTWELAIWRRANIGPFLNLGQLTWGNGRAAPLSIVYDGATTISWILGTTTISTTQLGGRFTDIFVRTRASRTGTVALSGLQFAGGINVGNLSSVGDGAVNYLRISNGNTPFSAFTLQGAETLSWIVNDPPLNSQLSAQFRFTNVPGVGTAMVGAAGCVAATRRRRR